MSRSTTLRPRSIVNTVRRCLLLRKADMSQPPFCAQAAGNAFVLGVMRGRPMIVPKRARTAAGSHAVSGQQLEQQGRRVRSWMHCEPVGQHQSPSPRWQQNASL
jgi:hypothetical protein